MCRTGQGFSSRLKAPSVVFAIGEAAARTVAEDPRTSIVTLLAKSLPSASRAGISLFIDPRSVITRAIGLQPNLRVLQFVHLRQTPKAIVDRARRAATRAGMQVKAIPVASVRDAAKAIEQLKALPKGQAAAWFHKGVLALNPDILVPNLVRVSWDQYVITIADEADYVERGVLMGVTHDFRKLGELAARAYAQGENGLLFSAEAVWMLNLRTARALGIRLNSPQARSFNSVFE